MEGGTPNRTGSRGRFRPPVRRVDFDKENEAPQKVLRSTKRPAANECPATGSKLQKLELNCQLPIALFQNPTIEKGENDATNKGSEFITSMSRRDLSPPISPPMSFTSEAGFDSPVAPNGSAGGMPTGFQPDGEQTPGGYGFSSSGSNENGRKCPDEILSLISEHQPLTESEPAGASVSKILSSHSLAPASPNSDRSSVRGKRHRRTRNFVHSDSSSSDAEENTPRQRSTIESFSSDEGNRTRRLSSRDSSSSAREGNRTRRFSSEVSSLDEEETASQHLHPEPDCSSPESSGSRGGKSPNNGASENLSNQHQTPPEPEPGANKIRTKRSVRQPISSSRLQRKVARNTGQEYTTSTGKIVPKKAAEVLGNCRKKCSEKISPEVGVELCDAVWSNLGDVNARRSYIAGQINATPKQTQKLSTASPSKRRNRVFSFTYHACVNGTNIEVCKGCFLKIYQVSPKFIEIVMGHKIQNMAGVAPKDMRGLSSKSCPDESIQEVINHLNSFPKYKSHYGRQKTDKEFLSSNLTLKAMFEDYSSKVEKPVSRLTYEIQFKILGLKIKPLKIDTCHRCDKLQISIRYAKSEAEKTERQDQQQLHHLKAEKAIDVKKCDRQKAKSSNTVETVAFDLQQCLPTPNLSSSIVFYLRQLWVYNLTIHLMSNDTSIHNMWHEAEGGRGANQVGSALYRFVLSLPDRVEHLILWSDTCTGQNKNAVINTALIAALSKKKSLKLIDQKFLVPGHTHLECDTDHAVIESKKKHAPPVHVPRDWYNIVRRASKKFTVQPLSQQDQFDFKALYTGRESPLVKRKKTTLKEDFLWRDVVWLQHRRDLETGVVAFKKTLEDDADFYYLDMRRKKKHPIVELPLKQKYDGPVKISSKKKEDLLSMIHLIDPECHNFYKTLQTDKSIPADIDPDIQPDTDIEDSGEE